MRVSRNIFIIGILALVLVISPGCSSTGSESPAPQSSASETENIQTPETTPSTETEKVTETKSEPETPLSTTTVSTTPVSTPPTSTTSTSTTTTKPVVTSTPSPTSTPATTTTTPSNVSYTQSDFSAITYTEITETYMTMASINASNDTSNQLTPGTILLYRTSEGRPGKLYILEYGDVIKLRWVTFTPDGSIFSQGEKLSVKLTSVCDLDKGTTVSAGEDFYYQQVDDTERYLISRNEAVYAIYNPGSQTTPINPGQNVSQEIEFTIETKDYRGYYVAYEKYLTAGDEITGLVQINAESGFNISWYFQIVDPNGAIERSWLKPVNMYDETTNELEFSHVALKTGIYNIRVLNYSECILLSYIKISPSGWAFIKEGISTASWKITK